MEKPYWYNAYGKFASHIRHKHAHISCANMVSGYTSSWCIGTIDNVTDIDESAESIAKNLETHKAGSTAIQSYDEAWRVEESGWEHTTSCTISLEVIM